MHLTFLLIFELSSEGAVASICFSESMRTGICLLTRKWSVAVFLLFLLFPAISDAQISDDGVSSVILENEQQIEDVSAPDHRSDDDFLRRYGSGKVDDVELLKRSLQSRIQRRLVLYANASASAGGGPHAPFWFTSNRQGMSPTKNWGVLLDIGLDGGMRLPDNFVFNYGMEVAVAANYQSDFYFHQMYIEAGYKWFDLSLGMKERWGELKNPRLSSGSLTWSGNSRPIPQIRLEIPEFTRMRILGGWFSVKAHIAYGWYLDSRWRADTEMSYYSGINEDYFYVDKLLYHSKDFFLKFGDTERFPLEVTIGLEMHAQFGGTKHFGPNDRIEELPHGLKAYAGILFPFNVVGEQGKENGNTLGSWHLAFGLSLNGWKYKAYYEHFFEDHSSMLGIEYKADLNGQKSFICYGIRRNMLDGLFGLEVNAPEGLPFSNIVFEVLNTRGQSGPVCRTPWWQGIIPEGVDGIDDYYHHEFYHSYSYYGYSNGSPLLVSPIYNEDGDLKPKSNRVLSFHLGVDGSISPSFEYRVLATHTTHWGRYYIPFREKEYVTSALIECNYRFKRSGWKLGFSLAADFDSGSLVGNNKGAMLTVSKIWKML